MSPPTTEPLPWQRWAIRTYLTIRVSTLGFSLLLPLVGSASAAPEWRPAHAAWLVAAALAFHIFAYVLNDVVDLDLDRSEPLRADSPLVRGEFSRVRALALAWAQAPIAFGAAVAGGAGAAALGWLGLAFLAMAVYDVYGKRCPWPLATDAVQAAGWCALLLTGAWHVEAPPPGASGWAVGYVFLCVLMVNGVHGGLRDLANDQRCGARTTALWLGARAGSGGAVVLSPAITRYALTLQGGLAVCAIGAAVAFAEGDASGAALFAILATQGVACASLIAAFRRRHDRRALVAAGAWNIVATVLVLPVLVWTRTGAPGGAAALGIFGLPVIAMWAYNGSHWHLSITEEPPS